MDSEYWLNLPAPNTPVALAQFDLYFYETLCYRLRQLREQNLARCELLSEHALEYRVGHTPPAISEQDKDRSEYIKYLEPETPPTPLTPVSLIHGKHHDSSVSVPPLPSTPNSTQTNVSIPPTPSKQSPVLFSTHEETTLLREATQKRKRDSEDDHEPHNEAEGRCGVQARRRAKYLRSCVSLDHTTGHE